MSVCDVLVYMKVSISLNFAQLCNPVSLKNTGEGLAHDAYEQTFA